MIQAIVWDFDGVIVDSEPLHYRAFSEVARPLGITFSWEQYLETYIGFDDRDAFRAMLGSDDHRLPDLVAQKADAFQNAVNEGVEAIPGAIELIEHVAAHLPQMVCSGASLQDIELVLDKLKLRHHFRDVVSADDVAHSKPDPQSYILAVEKLGLDASECMAIEDTAAGIASARGAGLWTLGLTSTSDRETLRNAHRVVDTLEGVTVDQIRTWF
jgi:HAD superfamily hydrolase (TIGR01509 family)